MDDLGRARGLRWTKGAGREEPALQTRLSPLGSDPDQTLRDVALRSVLLQAAEVPQLRRGARSERDGRRLLGHEELVMTDLTKAITEALDQAERLARGASPGPWRHVGRNMIEPAAPIEVTEADWGRDGHTLMFVHANEGQGAWSVPDVAHIAANDPATVLRAVAADRRVLERHAPCGRFDHNDLSGHCGVCWKRWPCEDIRDLADRLGVTGVET